MDKVFKKVKENAIVQFWVSYMIIILLIFGGSIMGINRAFEIVKTDLIEKNEDMLIQSIDQIDNILSNIYVNGMKLSHSSNLKLLGQMDKNTYSGNYYSTVKAVLSEYADIIRYLDTTFYLSNTFIYLDKMECILFENSVYKKEIFQKSADKWELPMEEWMVLCQEEKAIPFYYTSNAGEIFYLFPCMTSLQNKERFGTIFWKIEKTEILEQFGFLENYSLYSLFIHKNGECLLTEDGLGCMNTLDQQCFLYEGIYSYKNNIVIAIQSKRETDMVYTLVVPQQEAMDKLQILKLYSWLLLLGAVILGGVIAWLFAARSGKPINMIADILKERDTDLTYVNLLKIRDRVEQIVTEQQKNQKELQKAFLHNLLNANFLSESEMRYMASSAGVQLTGECYYAAAIRIFSQIDGESIDMQTVEEAKVIQVLIMERIAERHDLAVWSYKKNTLTTLYIIEERDKNSLVRLLEDIIVWLRNDWHVDARWGVGSICKDMMYLWRGAEEAMMALDFEETENPVTFYAEMDFLDGGYRFPYSVEEHLMQGLRAGNYSEVLSAIEMIKKDNFVYRTIGHNQFLKLNRDICDILVEHMKAWEDQEEKLIRLSLLIPERKGEYFPYFEYLSTLCNEICSQSIQQRSKKHEEKVKAIIEFLEQNYANSNMGLGMVSEKFKISESYLSLIFKERTGITFGDYLEKIRIEQACRLLKEGMLIAVVAEKTGYNSIQSFRRAFKRVKKVSPSEYKE